MALSPGTVIADEQVVLCQVYRFPTIVNSKLSLIWDPVALGENPSVPGPLFSWLGTSEPSRPLDRPTDASFRRTSSCPILIPVATHLEWCTGQTEELSPALSQGNRALVRT